MKRESSLGRRTALMLSALLIALVSFVTASAQQGTSSVRGTVKDPQGNVVSGATVTLSNTGTNSSRTATTTENGVYGFEFVAVGDYSVEVEAPGFKKAVVTTIHALVAKPTSVDIQLEIGNVSESVTVASGSAELLVNRDDGSL